MYRDVLATRILRRIHTIYNHTTMRYRASTKRMGGAPLMYRPQYPIIADHKSAYEYVPGVYGVACIFRFQPQRSVFLPSFVRSCPSRPVDWSDGSSVRSPAHPLVALRTHGWPEAGKYGCGHCSQQHKTVPGSTLAQRRYGRGRPGGNSKRS